MVCRFAITAIGEYQSKTKTFKAVALFNDCDKKGPKTCNEIAIRDPIGIKGYDFRSLEYSFCTQGVVDRFAIVPLNISVQVAKRELPSPAHVIQVSGAATLDFSGAMTLSPKPLPYDP